MTIRYHPEDVRRWAERLRDAAAHLPMAIVAEELRTTVEQARQEWPRDTGESAADLYVVARDGLVSIGCSAPYASHVHGGKAWARVEAQALEAVERAARKAGAAIAQAGR